MAPSLNADPAALLKQYWGYDAFRPFQKEIIESLIGGNDTLALLPTGGGKSICYQIPAMVKLGICIVVSPLIALMKDQVEQLKSRDIKALALYSGMTYKEIDLTLNNCIHGDYKFLYVSPERLKTDAFRDRMMEMPVSLLAVDEAHCISQWGYDFRPEYLQIAEVRELLPKVPLIAVTATATAEVAEDICEKLHFKKPNIFKSSFERSNLSFVVRQNEDKQAQLLKIAKSIKGSGIVYADTRKMTKELAEHLHRHDIKSSFYHAGLPAEQRSKRQDEWLKGSCRVMVCTNAFGMGIDKSDVRFVVHYQMPQGIEAYYQEAGRAGRDGKKSYAVLLHRQEDSRNALEKLKLQNPELAAVRQVYDQLCQQLQIAYGQGQLQVHPFDINQFALSVDMQPIKLTACLRVLEQQGWLRMSDGLSSPSRMMILTNQAELYKLQVEKPSIDGLIKTLLRMYGGLFDYYTLIREEEVAKKLKAPVASIQKTLTWLHDNEVIEYIPRNDNPRITFLESCVPKDQMQFDIKQMKQLAEANEKRLKAIAAYAENTKKCRSLVLREYFGDKKGMPCGICDICLEHHKQVMHHTEYENVREAILAKTKSGPLPLRAITANLPENKKELWIHVIRQMMDNGELKLDGEMVSGA